MGVIKKRKKMKRIGLALGSGGARGFCHVGVLKVFEEYNIPVDYISGCSMGALVGGCYCAGSKLNELEEIVNKLNQLMIMDFDVLLRNQGLLRGNKAYMILKRLLGNKQFSDCRIPFACTAVDAVKGELLEFTEGEMILPLRASMSMPAVFQSVKIGERNSMIDGGVMERVPINAVRNLGADIVIAVDALGPPEPEPELKNFIDMIERAYLLMDWVHAKDQVLNADVLITPNQNHRHIRDFKNNGDSVKAGELAAREKMPEILKLLGLD